jgi:hypothetical protein
VFPSLGYRRAIDSWSIQDSNPIPQKDQMLPGCVALIAYTVSKKYTHIKKW